MKPEKIPKLPIIAYHLRSYINQFGPTMELSQVQLISHDERGWEFKWIKSIWLLSPREISDGWMVYHDNEYENFFFDVLSARNRILSDLQKYRKTIFDSNQKELAEIKKLSCTINDKITFQIELGKQLESLHEIKIPEIKELHGKTL